MASTRELRNPLTIGYAALFSFWIVAGDAVNDAALADPLGRRLLAALDSAGSAFELAFYTFAAAMIGSLLWNGGVSRLVRFLAIRAGHPDWNSMIDEARDAVRRYEEYQVTTYKGQPGTNPSPTDLRHLVPSPRQAAHLSGRVEERERKAAEMSFRVTLAVALVPVAIGLGFDGGGLWWWSLSAIPVVWFDVALMKHTTLRTVRRFQLEDAKTNLERAEETLKTLIERAAQQAGSERAGPQHAAVSPARIKQYQEQVDDLKATVERLRAEEARRLSKVFAFLEGGPAN